jgi:hypothetical protein
MDSWRLDGSIAPWTRLPERPLLIIPPPYPLPPQTRCSLPRRHVRTVVWSRACYPDDRERSRGTAERIHRTWGVGGPTPSSGNGAGACRSRAIIQQFSLSTAPGHTSRIRVRMRRDTLWPDLCIGTDPSFFPKQNRILENWSFRETGGHGPFAKKLWSRSDPPGLERKLATTLRA